MPIPDHIDIFHLTREMPASDKTALQCVMEVDEERVQLERLAESLAHCEDDGQLLNIACNDFVLETVSSPRPLYPMENCTSISRFNAVSFKTGIFSGVANSWTSRS